uniref:DNA-directed RNA polymerase n=1 Tax=Siphoviridae sp. ct4Z13 TaxID=2827778 RepID=A0A8S5SB44_9CAUD|nr:MAG TPA: DNA-directed RNA polymerase [Siphoviridae sp. ct4Z13]
MDISSNYNFIISTVCPFVNYFCPICPNILTNLSKYIIL